MLHRPARSAGLLALALTGLVTTAAAPTQAATLYRWNDASGSPVVSDRPPPPGTPYTTLDGRRYGTSGAIDQPQVGQPAKSAPDRAAADREAPAENSPKTITVVEKRPDLCEQAKDNIFKLETFPRIRTTDPDGTVRFMSEQEIEGQLATAKKVAEANC